MVKQLDPREVGAPIIPSQSAASQQFSAWLEGAKKEFLLDAENQYWKVAYSFDYSHADGWELTLWLELDTNTKELVAAKVLSLSEDQRLIELLADNIPRMKLRPKSFSTQSMEDGILRLKTEVMQMEQALLRVDTAEVKKKIVCDWLNRSLQFGEL